MYHSNGRDDYAIACYRKALAYVPLRVRTWIWLIAIRARLMAAAAFGSKRLPTLPTATASDAHSIGSQRFAA
jgi:hypothetical protein